MNQKVNLSKYALRFGGIYLILLVAASVIMAAFKINHSISVSIGILCGAASIVSNQFINEFKRSPTPIEKSKLSLYSLTAAFFASAAFSGSLIYFSSGTEGLYEFVGELFSMGPFVTALTVVFLGLLYYALLSFFYGNIAKRQYDSLIRSGKI